jgi:AcrR family transcriptional regulator
MVIAMVGVRRTRLTPEERREQLTALGVAFLATRPLDELTIEVLSEQAGVSRGLVFHYFGSKQGLHRDVVTLARDGMLHATTPRRDLAPRERLHDTLTRIVMFVREHSGVFASLVRGSSSRDAEASRVVDEARDAQAARLLEVYGELGYRDTRMLRVALHSWVVFAQEVLLDLALGTGTPVEQIVAFLEQSVEGVVAAAQGPRHPNPAGEAPLDSEGQPL